MHEHSVTYCTDDVYNVIQRFLYCVVPLSGCESVHYFYNILSMEHSMTLLLHWWCWLCRSLPAILCGLFECGSADFIIIVSLYLCYRWISSFKEVESLDQINLCSGQSVLYKDINFHQHMPRSFYDQWFVVRGSC